MKAVAEQDQHLDCIAMKRSIQRRDRQKSWDRCFCAAQFNEIKDLRESHSSHSSHRSHLVGSVYKGKLPPKPKA